ncbi:MAG: response regulator transcription factor [Filimonas sp.]|nr:response regulator transcription factor [Filimonas sp.]
MIRCIVVDDEPWALALLSDYIKKVPFLELVFATENAIEALQRLPQEKVDLVFLDIQMPEITGLQFMKIISGKVRVILTTAYSEYALDGYEHNVIDYLLKPISFDRFYIAASKAKDLLDTPVVQQAPVVPQAIVATGNALPDFIFVKTDSRIVKILLSEIRYIEGLKDYIAIHTLSEKIITLESLKVIEEGLPKPRFLRVHKSYIVSLEHIDSIERSRIFIRDVVIPIGDTYKDQFFGAIEGKNFG